MISAGRLQANTPYFTMPEYNQTSCFAVEDNKSVPTHLTPIWDIILVTMEYPTMNTSCYNISREMIISPD